MSEDLLDCAIVGAGPAGLTAATYLARFRRRVALLSHGGSRARYIPVTHNCPGFPFGISGGDLLEKLRAQAAAFGVEPVDARVDGIARAQEGFAVRAGARRWRARTVLLATGVVDRLPSLDAVERGIADGVVRLCAICDGYEAAAHRILVHGPAASVMGHAAFLRTFSARVSVLLSDDGALDDTARARADALGIRVLEPVESLRLSGAGEAAGCVVRHADGAGEDFDSLYPVLGGDPKAGLARGLGAEVDDSGELRVDARLQTSVDGLYAAGDVVSALNQISVAVGHAAIAATAIHNRLPPNPMD